MTLETIFKVSHDESMGAKDHQGVTNLETQEFSAGFIKGITLRDH